MSNEITKLEAAITEGLQLIGTIHDAVELANDKLNGLKELKETEESNIVKPVFPDNSIWYACNQQFLAVDMGLAAYDIEGMELIERQLKARKFVIEAINVANWDHGGNGFIVGECNYLFNYDHDIGKFFYYDSQRQLSETGLYLRGNALGEKLLNNPKFVENYKIMLGIS